MIKGGSAAIRWPRLISYGILMLLITFVLLYINLSDSSIIEQETANSPIHIDDDQRNLYTRIAKKHIISIQGHTDFEGKLAIDKDRIISAAYTNSAHSIFIEGCELDFVPTSEALISYRHSYGKSRRFIQWALWRLFVGRLHNAEVYLNRADSIIDRVHGPCARYVRTTQTMHLHTELSQMSRVFSNPEPVLLNIDYFPIVSGILLNDEDFRTRITMSVVTGEVTSISFREFDCSNSIH